MKYIFLIAVFNALLFVVFLLQKKPRFLYDNILIGWLTFLSVFIGTYAFYSHELFTHFRLLSISLVSLFLLHGPFLFFYVRALVSGRQKFPGYDLSHLLPFVLFNLYILVCSFDPPAAERLNIERLSNGFNPPILFLLFLVLTALSGTVYFILTLHLFRKFDIRIFNTYSSLAGIDLKWLRLLVIIFGIAWTILICITMIHHVFNMFSMIFCTDGLFLSLSAFVILIGYFGLKQKIIFAQGEISVPENGPIPMTKYAGSRLTDPEAKLYAEKLLTLMSSSKPYLNPELNLSQLAGNLGISSHFLSQVINEKFGSNFFDFINEYRVEEFKLKLSDSKYSCFSLLGIALECGFNSKSAFNRIFKQKTGLTPSQFKTTYNH